MKTTPHQALLAGLLGLLACLGCGQDSGTAPPAQSGSSATLTSPGDNPSLPSSSAATVRVVGAIGGRLLEERQYRGTPCGSEYPYRVSCTLDSLDRELHVRVERPGGDLLLEVKIAATPGPGAGQGQGGRAGLTPVDQLVWTTDAPSLRYSTGATRSPCTAGLTALDTAHAAGTVECTGLVDDSLQSNADLSIGFDCPLADPKLGSPPLCPSTVGAPGKGGSGGTLGQAGSPGGAGKPIGTAGSPTDASCHGLTLCSGLYETECWATLGCSYSGSCTGVSDSCYSQYSSYSCSSLAGCYWSSYSNDCSGSSETCSTQHSSISCTYQSGCHWKEACQGTAYPCSSHYSQASCEYQTGCYWY